MSFLGWGSKLRPRLDPRISDFATIAEANGAVQSPPTCGKVVADIPA